MLISGLEKMSLVDYDGFVSATIFTGGCNFRCGFCHNSPLVLGYKSLPIIDENQVLDYLKKRKGLLDGVCISGGEPTLQKDLPAFIEKIKALGYSVKLDTNGTSPDLVKSLWENGLVDYFATDIKSDKKGYSNIIGIDGYDLSKVEKTVDYFLNNGVNYELRTTLIKEYHDNQVMKNIGEWIKGANKYFLQKYIDNENCIRSGYSEVSKEQAEEFKALLSPLIPNTYLRGY
ncbi:MAG: anaerobic ribonucleoside-triphosphate reductase activating protein [Clostridia bacterium]|nr:anaerobic ribonucleoside-triphosphate reductase activating protein [Clostridia bacterium]